MTQIKTQGSRLVLAATIAGFCAVVAACVPLGQRAAQAQDVSLPNRVMTPGAAIKGVTVAEICTAGYSSSVRHVTAETKREVYREYGLARNHTGYCADDQGCEVDHLISLELGGSNDIANLWPEPYGGITWNAHVKDRLENRLHKLVCAGEMPLSEAQHYIAMDWIAAYRRLIGDP